MAQVKKNKKSSKAEDRNRNISLKKENKKKVQERSMYKDSFPVFRVFSAFLLTSLLSHVVWISTIGSWRIIGIVPG